MLVWSWKRRICWTSCTITHKPVFNRTVSECNMSYSCLESVMPFQYTACTRHLSPIPLMDGTQSCGDLSIYVSCVMDWQGNIYKESDVHNLYNLWAVENYWAVRHSSFQQIFDVSIWAKIIQWLCNRTICNAISVFLKKWFNLPVRKSVWFQQKVVWLDNFWTDASLIAWPPYS
jgi:hypothetical protein